MLIIYRIEIIIASILLLLIVGCSSGSLTPVAPKIETADISAVTHNNNQSPCTHVPLGVYELALNNDGTFEVTQIRSEETHINVKNMLFPPKCLDCFVAQLLSVVGEHWQFSFTIKNPSSITGYDCRVIVLDSGDITILDPTSYTTTFALPNDPDPINPFVVFDTGNGQNKWIPGATATSIVNFFKPTTAKFSKIIFAIDASYPGNQDDPYKITGLNADRGI